MLAIGIWSLLCILWATILYPFYPSSKATVFWTQRLWAPGALFFFNAKTRVHGVEQIDPESSYIIMANHSSFLDIPAIGYRIPLWQFFIAKKELKRIPFLGQFMYIAGVIFIDRSNHTKSRESIAKAALLIAKGKNVVIFPEGTASRDGNIGKFKKGGFHLAKQSKAPVLPVRVTGTRQIWPRGKILRGKGGKVYLIIGKPITYKEYRDWEINEFSNKVRETLIELGK